MSTEEKVQTIYSLITKIMKVKNRFYVTNILILVVENTFEAKKHLNLSDIRVLQIYDICIEILNTMLLTGESQYELASVFMANYMPHLV